MTQDGRCFGICLLVFFLIISRLQPYIDMKKNILICTLAAIVAFVAGYSTCLMVNTDSVESASFKRKLIDAQNAALEKAEIVMDNNNLWDTDGSDDMAEYLELCYEVDSLWETQL